MRTINITKARADLYNLLIEASESHEPIRITGKKSNAVLVSEEDWRSIQETLYLLSISGMRESIIEGLNSEVDSDTEELDW
ncbi:MAG: type II toxin-antitoxin system Phd/YefM family antitoxin [Candidatus Marinimicrobia bacterium]|nr:type II toxin-antitoxin system Phd/YefM family antitoxin [Candidatus Neomarinimicrobiota bacterium]